MDNNFIYTNNIINESLDYKEFMIFLMHELRHINYMIKSSSELLSITVKGEKVDCDNLRHHANIIFEQSSVLSSWLAVVDYHLFPNSFSKHNKTIVSLYRLFDKAKINLKRRAHDLNVCIQMTGQGEFSLSTYPIIDILPYLLLDNALKYSIKNGVITINLTEIENIYIISIKSMGPFVEFGEIDKIFVHGYRGKNAIHKSEIGNGMGLALVKKICDIHNASVSATSENPTFNYNNCPYSDFNITMRFPINKEQ